MINWPLPSLSIQCRSKSYNFMDDGVSLEYEELFEGAEDGKDFKIWTVKILHEILSYNLI